MMDSHSTPAPGAFALLASAALAIPWAPGRAQAPAAPDTAAVVAGELGRRLDAYLTRAEAFGFAAAVLVAKDGELVLRKGYGEADRESGRPVTPATVFTVGSITKQFTGAAILKLEEQGRLRVTDSLGRFFPDVPADKAGITLHHLLTHTAGFGGDFGGDYEVMPRDSLVRLALAAPLRSPPGARHRYANVGYSILGAVVELASGRPYETYLREALFEPAGIRETGYRFPGWSPERVAAAYRGVDRWGTTVERPWAPDGPWWNLRANGGILSTVGDLYRWHLALEDDRVLSAKSRERFMAPHVPENAEGSSHYGYGWAVTPTARGTRLVWHNGGNGFFFADFRRYMDERVVVIFLTNESVHERVERSLMRVLFGMDVAMPPAAGRAPAPERLARIAGRYHLPSGAEFEVRAHAGRLEVAAADPEVAAAFVTFPQPAEGARARLTGMDSVVQAVVGGMARGDFGAFRQHFLRTGDVSVEEEVAFWTGAFEAWPQRLGPYRGFARLGTAPGRSPGGPTLDTWVAVRFERGVRLIQFIQAAEGPPMGFYLHAASDRALPARHLLVPAGPDGFVTFDFTFERATMVRVEAAESGEPQALVIASPGGDVLAVRVH